MNQQLVNYVEEELKKGISKKEITSRLVSSGWELESVNSVFASFNNSSGTRKLISVIFFLVAVFILFLIGLIILIVRYGVDSKVCSDCGVPIAIDSYPKPLRGDNYSNIKPMYGYLNYEDYVANRTEYINAIDEKFLDCLSGDQKKDFNNLFSSAEIYRKAGDLDTAMKRVNQAWLIDHENHNVYWGYGMILGSRKDLVDSITYFEKAMLEYSDINKIRDDDYQRLTLDTANTYMHFYLTHNIDDDESKVYILEKVINLVSPLLNSSLKLPEESYSEALFNLSSAYFLKEEYNKSREIFIKLSNEYPEARNKISAVNLDQRLKDMGY